MTKFKDPTNMLPSEMVAYIQALHSEIEGQNTEIAALRKADTFVLGMDNQFLSQEDMLADLQRGSVRQATLFRKLKTCWLVKINDDRVDEYDDRVKAEGVAMLHGV